MSDMSNKVDIVLPDFMDIVFQYKDVPIPESCRKKLIKYKAPKCELSKTEPNSDVDIFNYFRLLEDIPLTKDELVHLYITYTMRDFVKSTGEPYSHPLDRIQYLLKKHKVQVYSVKHKSKPKPKKEPRPKKPLRTRPKNATIGKVREYRASKAMDDAKNCHDQAKHNTKKEEIKLEKLRQELELQEEKVKKTTKLRDKNEVKLKKERIKSLDDSKLQTKPVEVDEKTKSALKNKKIIFQPNEGPQTAFLAASETDVLYGGAAGGGKSYAMIVDPLRYCSNSSHRALVLRRSMPELRELIDKSRELYPIAFRGAKFKEVEKTWYFASGAQVMFGYCEKDSDVYQYQGRAFSWIGYDEITHLGTEFPWNYLASRLRTTDPNLPTFLRCTANPGGPGHQWVKKRYIDPSPANESFMGEDGIQRKFIAATLHDNPHLSSDGRYEQMLKSLPEVHRKRLLNGDWDVNEGAAFSEFNPAMHVIEPFDIPPNWERVKGVDYGYAAESACLWAAIDPSDGTLIIYRELYEKGLTGEALGHKMTAYEDDERRSIAGVLDTAAWNRTGYAGPTIGEELVKQGHRLRPADKNRIAGKVQIHERLKIAESGRPKMQIVSTCINLVRELSSIQYDKTKTEDVDTKMSDHAYDALRYLVMSRPRMETREELSFQFKQQAMLQPTDTFFGY
jgi:PBSX family phage terminase large subunit